MKPNKIVEAINNSKQEVPVIETEKPKSLEQLTDFEITIPEALEKLKNRKPFSLETLIRRIICTGSNSIFVEDHNRIVSKTAFNGYHAEMLANFNTVVGLVKDSKYSLGNAAKKNRLMILAYMSSIGDKEQSSLALNTAMNLCIHASDILYLACYIKTFRGFGRLVKKVLSTWYLERNPVDLLGEVIECPKVSIKTVSQTISFDHRGLVRRLYLRGSDDVQDACFRIIKQYEGSSSEIPGRFLTYMQVCALDMRVAGSKETMAIITEGLPFKETAYPEEIREMEEFRGTAFYARNLSGLAFMKDIESGFAMRYLDDKVAPRIEYNIRRMIEAEELSPVDILRVQQRVRHELPDLTHGLTELYKELEKPSESFNEHNVVFAFLGYERDMNIKIFANAYHRARQLGCNIVLAHHGVIVLDPKTFTFIDAIKHVVGGNKQTPIITSRAMINILSDAGTKFENVVVYEETSGVGTRGEVDEFLHALDTFITAKNPNMKIVNHQLGKETFSLLREPRHGGLLVVEGDNTRATQIVDIFLED